MYCKNCGTVNPGIADYCLKCGRGLGEALSAGAEAVSPVEIALAARPAGGPYAGTKKNFISRTIMAVMLAGLLVMVPIFFLLAQTGSAVYHPKSTGSAGPPGFGGLGLAPERSPMTLADDAVRKTNALRLRTAAAKFYAENDRYPGAISEIPPEMLGFMADPNIYKYAVRQDPYGFRIEVIMAGNNVSGANIVADGDVTKYIYENQ